MRVCDKSHVELYFSIGLVISIDCFCWLCLVDLTLKREVLFRHYNEATFSVRLDCSNLRKHKKYVTGGCLENKNLYLERGKRLVPMTRCLMLRTGMSSRIALAVELLSRSIVSTVTCHMKEVLIISMLLVHEWCVTE
jgi:hypothetical protein